MAAWLDQQAECREDCDVQSVKRKREMEYHIACKLLCTHQHHRRRDIGAYSNTSLGWLVGSLWISRCIWD